MLLSFLALTCNLSPKWGRRGFLCVCVFMEMTSHSQTPDVSKTDSKTNGTPDLSALLARRVTTKAGQSATPGFLKCPHQPSQELKVCVSGLMDLSLSSTHIFVCLFGEGRFSMLFILSSQRPSSLQRSAPLLCSSAPALFFGWNSWCLSPPPSPGHHKLR